MFKTHNTQSEALDTIVGTRTSFCCANQPSRKIKCTVVLPKNDCDKRINKLENSSFTSFLTNSGNWISVIEFLPFSVSAHRLTRIPNNKYETIRNDNEARCLFIGIILKR